MYKYLRNQFHDIIKSLYTGLTEFEVQFDRAPGNFEGDIATPLAFDLAQKLKRNPREIALEIVESLQLDDNKISRTEVAGGGFINLTINPDWLRSSLKAINQDVKEFRRISIGENKKIQVEFVSANPTGPLTIGHGRQAVIGDIISRLYEACGYNVSREYYFNNTGRQMRILADSVRLRCKELLGEKTEFPDNYYQGEYIIELATEFIEKYGKDLPEDEPDTFMTFAANKIIEGIKITLNTLGVDFDNFFNENSLIDDGEVLDVLELLQDNDLTYKEDGALWLKTSELGAKQDRVLIKSTGEMTYRLLDIAYHRNKLNRDFDMLIDIFGADHIGTYKDVLAGLKALGYDIDKIQVIIHQFVTLTENGEKIKMSTRKANFVTLDELIEEVGVDVTRFFFIMRSANSHLNFDLALAKSESDENPVFYVQYGCARISSILRFAKNQGLEYSEDIVMDENLLAKLDSNEELELMKKLFEYPRMVEKAAINIQPHIIPAYLIELAKVFHPFYHEYRVVSDNKELSLARIILVRAVREVIRDGLGLLGISAPDQM